MIGEEEKALHTIMIISTAILIAMLMMLFAVVASPSLSPISSVADWDGDGHPNRDDLFPMDSSEWVDSDDDGVGDNKDAFPFDDSEWYDSDEDGVGDNEDFFDAGNGAVRISLDTFEFLGYEGNYYRERYYPYPWFQINIDLNADGVFDRNESSEVFNATRVLDSFFEATFDIPEDIHALKFSVVVYDVWYVSSNDIVDYEIMDYSPIDGLKTVIHEIGLPCTGSWQSSGSGDSDTPDCELAYSLETLALL